MSNYPDDFNSASYEARYGGDESTGAAQEAKDALHAIREWAEASMLLAKRLGLSQSDTDNFWNDLVLTVTESSLEKVYADALDKIEEGDGWGARDSFSAMFNCRPVELKSTALLNVGGRA